jgi:hypothetical protein
MSEFPETVAVLRPPPILRLCPIRVLAASDFTFATVLLRGNPNVLIISQVVGFAAAKEADAYGVVKRRLFVPSLKRTPPPAVLTRIL